MAKLELIINSINNIKPNNQRFFIKAKKERIKFYSENLEKIEKLSDEQILNFSFFNEIFDLAENLEKIDYFNKYKYSKIISLEYHEYSPEQNKLHFKKSFINVPYCKTIAEAIINIIKSQSLEQIKTI
jgi:hypothetical protein